MDNANPPSETRGGRPDEGAGGAGGFSRPVGGGAGGRGETAGEAIRNVASDPVNAIPLALPGGSLITGVQVLRRMNLVSGGQANPPPQRSGSESSDDADRRQQQATLLKRRRAAEQEQASLGASSEVSSAPSVGVSAPASGDASQRSSGEGFSLGTSLLKDKFRRFI